MWSSTCVRPPLSPLPRRPRPPSPALAAASQRGRSGIDVVGSRPTSPKAWEEISTTLKSKGVQFVEPRELGAVQRRGVTVVDIRPAGEYAEGHIPGSVNVEFYRVRNDRGL
jgi:hypothetical protein